MCIYSSICIIAPVHTIVFIAGLGVEHEMMSHFVSGVDDIVQQPPRRENTMIQHDSSEPYSASHSHYSSDLLDTDDEVSLVDQNHHVQIS